MLDGCSTMLGDLIVRPHFSRGESAQEYHIHSHLIAPLQSRMLEQVIVQNSVLNELELHGLSSYLQSSCQVTD
jgi:hypothetical protein